MTTLILLFAMGITLIALEVIIPGGIIGAIGGLLMLAGCVLSFVLFGTTGGLIAVASALALSAIILWIEFRVLPQTRLGKRAFLTQQITAVSAAFGEDARAFIGKPATALTTLAPSGYIGIDGQRYEAFCQSGHATAGTALIVTGADNFRLIVSSSPSSNT